MNTFQSIPIGERPQERLREKGPHALSDAELLAVLLRSGDEVLLISDGGTLVRTRAAEISQVGRNTQGVTLMRLSEGEHLQALERLDGSLVDDESADPASPPIMPVDLPADVIVDASSDAPQPDANA
jgi:DNA gyrase subunit A